ncbi:Kiwa anti-phage protein KwaB-like domain-containing protein [Shewanella algae]|uniref:Kiwa anti-phage protein KwaB-like domain-containing protein n=1 Tax=Shewanella algae TaxID=38313 RepID=UPI001AAD9D3C|nr:Kiwa anti-phage protein KwaB-like domain-containing protein [Shewanella algae]MBO2578814.1 DUF4868 domain-containing protein [Shewanella algae]MBO2684289.1 DUF4868 domain-containing protein [Shewanella algae]
MPFNFFALIKENNETHVNRVALGNDLQNELSGMFTEQKNAFVNENVDVIPFDGQYKPEHDEVLAIGGFELPDQFKEAIDSPMTLPPLHFNEDANGKIVAIFCGLNEGGNYKVLVQLFEGTRLIKPNMMNIIFGANDEFQKLDYFGMTLDSKLTAYYENNQLHFKSYHFARRIFDLSGHYREATNQEVIALANHDHFAPVDQAEFLEMADHVVRQTIARIQRNDVLANFSVQELAHKASDVNLQLEINDDQKIVLPDEKRELKLVLSFLDDQVFLGPITGQTRVSNSSKVVAVV